MVFTRQAVNLKDVPERYTFLTRNREKTVLVRHDLRRDVVGSGSGACSIRPGAGTEGGKRSVLCGTGRLSPVRICFSVTAPQTPAKGYPN